MDNKNLQGLDLISIDSDNCPLEKINSNLPSEELRVRLLKKYNNNTILLKICKQNLDKVWQSIIDCNAHTCFKQYCTKLYSEYTELNNTHNKMRNVIYYCGNADIGVDELLSLLKIVDNLICNFNDKVISFAQGKC